MDVGCWMLDVGWMLDGWLEKAELKPTQPSLAGAWLSLAKTLSLDFAGNEGVPLGR